MLKEKIFEKLFNFIFLLLQDLVVLEEVLATLFELGNFLLELLRCRVMLEILDDSLLILDFLIQLGDSLLVALAFFFFLVQLSLKILDFFVYLRGLLLDRYEDLFHARLVLRHKLEYLPVIRCTKILIWSIYLLRL